jgi:DNA-directed RNA polymerase specialized sigma24 family protein
MAAGDQRLRSGSAERSLAGSRSVETSITPTPVQSIIAQERAAQLWRAIDALPDKLRIVVVLAGIEEHDIREVATLLASAGGNSKVSIVPGTDNALKE